MTRLFLVFLLNFFSTFTFFYSKNVFSVPGEGLNEWGIRKQNQKSNGQFNLSSNHSFWLENYNTVEGIYNYRSKEDLWIIGFKSSEQNPKTHRNAWFLKYEFVYGENSLSVKYLHENWYWLKSGKESIGFSYNMSTSWGFYHNVGYYYRWLKQQWDPSPYSPFNFDTNDKDGFFIINLGWAFPGRSGIFTVDVNNRDAFSYYSADNWALDTKYYWIMNRSWAITATLSIRFTGIWGASPYPGSGHMAFGVEF